MRRRRIVAAAVAAASAVGLVVASRVLAPGSSRPADPDPASASPADPVAPIEVPEKPVSTAGFQTGRVTTIDGTVYTGRLRWGGNQEAFWDDWFNGVKRNNPWVAKVPADQLPRDRRAISVFGVVLTHRERPFDFDRPFLMRFGDLARIEASGRDVRVTLRNGDAVDLDRLNASDFDDGLRVWDAQAGVVDLDSLQIRDIELGVPVPIGEMPPRLYGVVSAAGRTFAGFLEWDRWASSADQRLEGYDTAGPVEVRFTDVASIARVGIDRVAVTRRDGRTLELGGKNGAPGSRGVIVEDSHYGRVSVSWEAFELLELSAAPASAGSGPGYDTFQPARYLGGSVTTADGRTLEGRLVFDLDEHLSVETLDAPSGDVGYTIPFAAIATITVPVGDAPVAVGLTHGGELELERRGDLGASNAGLLVFLDGLERSEYVPWPDVAGISFDHARQW